MVSWKFSLCKSEGTFTFLNETYIHHILVRIIHETLTHFQEIPLPHNLLLCSCVPQVVQRKQRSKLRLVDWVPVCTNAI